MAVLEPLRADFDLARATLLLAALRQTQHADDAELLGEQAVSLILNGGYAFLLEQERALAFPLLAPTSIRLRRGCGHSPHNC
jgi:hypothetical protein